MRHWAQGLPPYAAPPVHGLPPRVWLQRFLLSHSREGGAWRRIEWPDGRPLLAQSWPQVLALRTIADELARIDAEQRKAAQNGVGQPRGVGG